MRPEKPYPEFPLYPHATGRWAKKIKGKFVYFGRWDDPEGALDEYHAYLAGDQQPRPAARLTLVDACDLFLAAKDQAREEGHLSEGSFREYHRTCKRLVKFWGESRSVDLLRPSDFNEYRTHRSQTCNLVSIGNEITRVKTLFKWLADSKIVEPLDFGPDFKRPSAKSLRRHRRVAGKKMFNPEEVRAIMAESGVMLRAMVHLAINCGYGNGDCEQVPLTNVLSAIETGWLEFARPKTEVDRRCPLWPETVDALREAMRFRTGDGAQAFTLANGEPFSSSVQHVAKRFRAAREHAYIKRGTFYWLRHTFQTVASSCGDQVAVNAIMGHVDGSMAAVYRQEVQDERLLRATNAVCSWLYQT